MNFIAYADMGTTAQPGAAGTVSNVLADVESGEFSFLLHPGLVDCLASDRFAHGFLQVIFRMQTALRGCGTNT